MKEIMTSERMEIIRQGGDLAVKLTEIMISEQAYKSLVKLKQTQEEVTQAKNGREKILTATQVVKELNIEGLTTTILNKWFVSRDLGEYKRFNFEKRRTFQPNQNFMTYIAEEGYSMTGHTADGTKVKVMYSWDMIHRINKLYRVDILNFVEIYI